MASKLIPAEQWKQRLWMNLLPLISDVTTSGAITEEEDILSGLSSLPIGSD
jgi:hypothetical protein